MIPLAAFAQASAASSLALFATRRPVAALSAFTPDPVPSRAPSRHRVHAPLPSLPSRVAPTAVAIRGSKQNPYRIAVLPGDGYGPEIASVAVSVLSALSELCELHFEFVHAPYGAPAFDESGTLVPQETVDACRGADAVLRSYQGTARGDGRTGSAHRPLLAVLGLFAQLRPVVVYPQLVGASTLRSDVVDAVDIMLVREVSAGALAAPAGGEGAGAAGGGGGGGSAATEARSDVSYTKEAVERIASVALQIAERRSGRVLNLDKADAMSVSQFFRQTLHAYFDEHAKGNDGITLDDMYVDDFVREVILRPAEFDTIVTSNLFGDIVAEVIAALAGPARVAPSVWVSRDGLGVYGPADIYNPEAYPSLKTSGPDTDAPSPIAIIRSASMMLRYALEEPAAADLIQQALRKTMEDVATVGIPNQGGKPVVDTTEFEQTVLRSLQLMRQFEQVCPPEICGE